MPKPSVVSVVSLNYTQYFLMDNKTVYKNGFEDKNIVQKNVSKMEICLDNPQEPRKLNFDDLPNEIIYMIHNKLDLESQIALRSVSKRLCNLKLTNFWNMKKHIVITDQVLENNRFIKRLDLSNNKNIKIVKDLPYLTKLNVTQSNVVKLHNLPNLKKIYLDKKIKLPNIDVKVIRSKRTSDNNHKRNSIDDVETAQKKKNRYYEYVRRKSADTVNNDIWLTNYYNYLNDINRNA